MAEVTARPGPGTAADRAKAVARRDVPAGVEQAENRAEQTPESGLAAQAAAARADRIGPAVVLIGPPGSGKSSVGAAIARVTGLALRDTDSDIERSAGRTIPDIFVEDGEQAFRAMERAAVRTALTEHSGVLALGGGAVLSQETRTNLAGHRVVFLNLSMPTGVRRTGLSSNRPLLAGVNPRATYRALLDARLSLYRETATMEIQTDQLSVAEVAMAVIEKLELS